MKILHVLKIGSVGSIEKMCFDIAKKCPDHEFLFIKESGPFVEDIKKLGNKTYVFFGEKKLSYTKLAIGKRRFKKMLMNNNYDGIVFHHYSYFLWSLARFAKKRFPSQKVFVYIHSDSHLFLSDNKSGYRYRRRKLVRTVEDADGIFAISEHVKECTTAIFPKLADKIHVVHNGVDLEEFSCKTLKKPHDPVRCIYVGRVSQDKGILNLVVAFNKFENAHLTVVGMGDIYDECQKLANEKISFVGRRANISKLLSSHDVFVFFPLFTEGFGITLVEAMAKGLLCVTNNKGALPEILENGRGGIILNSISELENVLKNVDSEKNLQIRQNALEISKKYSIEKTIADLEQYFK